MGGKLFAVDGDELEKVEAGVGGKLSAVDGGGLEKVEADEAYGVSSMSVLE